METYKYLLYTNLLLVISLFYFFFKRNKSLAECILATMIVIIIITSQIFWDNPIKKSDIHTTDAAIAKIVILSFIIYIFSYKFKFSFLIILLAICLSFYFSNYYSNQEWCCDQHIFCHGLLHIFSFFGTFYAFI
jgi:hypothetical protein